MNISQPDLIAEIGKLLAKKFGVKTILPRQFNAIIRAADLMMAELEKPYRPATPGCGLTAWLKSDDTGLSSKYLARLTLGLPRRAEEHYPLDEDDRQRCRHFLECVPAAKANLRREIDRDARWQFLEDLA